MKVLAADFFPWSRGLFFGNTHLMRQFLSDEHEVCWVSQYLHLARVLRKARRDDKIFLEAWREGLRQGPDGVWTYTPFSLLPHINMPFLGGRWVGLHAMQWTWPRVKGKLRKIGFHKPDVLWLGVPRVASMMNTVDAKAVVYRMCDLFTGFVGAPKGTEAIEEEMCRRSAVVFATAKPLVERAGQWADNVVYLPNGVDVTRFQGEQPPEPDILSGIPHPRVLYLGGLAHYVDMNVFETIARRRPDVHVVIVGPPQGVSGVLRKLESALAGFEEIPNIHYLGACEFSEAPAIMRNCDVGLMPFDATEREHAASPNKMYEYSAAGLPVVSRRLREAEAAGSDTLFYDDLDEMVACVDQAINEQDDLSGKMKAIR